MSAGQSNQKSEFPWVRPRLCGPNQKRGSCLCTPPTARECDLPWSGGSTRTELTWVAVIARMHGRSVFDRFQLQQHDEQYCIADSSTMLTSRLVARTQLCVLYALSKGWGREEPPQMTQISQPCGPAISGRNMTFLTVQDVLFSRFQCLKSEKARSCSTQLRDFRP